MYVYIYIYIFFFDVLSFRPWSILCISTPCTSTHICKATTSRRVSFELETASQHHNLRADISFGVSIMSRGSVARKFKEVCVSKFDHNGVDVVVIRGGALDDQEAWLPNDVVKENDREFIKITKTDTMLSKLCGCRFTRSKAFETLTHLRNAACVAALKIARTENVDRAEKLTKRALDASLALPLTVTIQLCGECSPSEPNDVVLQYVSDLRNAVAVSLDGDSLHHVCESISTCIDKGTKYMRDSTSLGDGFHFSNKRQTMWCTYQDDDGMPRRKSSRFVIAPPDVDDVAKVADAKYKMLSPDQLLSPAKE